MWVCTKCYHANSGDNQTCVSCHVQRGVPAATPRGRTMHRNADFLKDKKTMYTYANKKHWQRANQHTADSTECIYTRPSVESERREENISKEDGLAKLRIKNELENKIGQRRPDSFPPSPSKEKPAVSSPSISRSRPKSLSTVGKSIVAKQPIDKNVKLKDNYLIVAAIDFGTAYSGYAFSMRGSFDKEPLKIHSNQAWNAGGRQLLSLKTPTCLLLDSNKGFKAFGYEAENQYADIILDEDPNDYFFFRRFKMNLHNNKNIRGEMIVEDIKGRPVSAITIFSLFIKALVKHLMNLLNQQFIDIKIDDVRFVMTVPAIWNDSAKQFMRTCAEKAGIPKDQLMMALEPEAASIYCQYLPTEKLQGSDGKFGMTKPGTKYMVVDLGGGTADITVHEKVSNGHLKELSIATGNDCGGTSVDGRFFQLFVRIAGGPVMKAMQNADPGSYLDIFREFEQVKRTINPEKTGKVNMSIPYTALDEQCHKHLDEHLPAVLASSSLSKQIALRGDKMRIDADLIKEIFRLTIDEIIALMNQTLSTPKMSGVTQLLLVGGFSECRLIQEAVRRGFPDKRVIVPKDPGLAVLKGEVLFGHKPTFIESRIMRYTYGVRATDDWNADEYDIEHRKEEDVAYFCDNVFDIIVRKNETVDIGTAIECEFETFEKTDELEFKLYVSTKENPKYIDEEGCSFLGAAKIRFDGHCDKERKVKVGFVFGNTELGVTAVDRSTGHTVTSTFSLI